MISVNQKSLLRALKAAKKIAPRRSTMPVLACVKLTTTGNTLRIIGTDLTTTILTDVPCMGDLSAVVNAASLLDAVKAAGKADTILLDAEPGSVKVKGSADMTVRAEATGDFPDLPNMTPLDTITYHAPSLASALTFVIPAASIDETRYHLNGVLLNQDKMVSTDGHRLHLEADLPSVGEASYIIPRAAALAVLTLAKGAKGGNVVAKFGAALASFTDGATTVMVKLIDAQFPPYEQVIPKADYCAQGVTAKRGGFLSALKAATALANSRTFGVKLCANGDACSVEADNPDVGETRAPFAGKCRGGNPWRIGMNGRYLIEAVESLSANDITVLSDSELDPIRIDDGPRTAVIMPMRI